jgi:hypothetical protein
MQLLLIQEVYPCHTRDTTSLAYVKFDIQLLFMLQDPRGIELLTYL